MNRANVRVFAPYVHSQSSNNEWRAYCPQHEDPRTSKTPSASFKFVEDVWHCAGCGAGGSLAVLRRGMVKSELYNGPHPIPYQTIIATIDKAMVDSGEEDDVMPLPSKARVKQWSDDLLKNRYMLRAFREKRGLTPATIKEYQLGWDGMRYTIPVWDADGALVNVRRYKITNVHRNKMVNLPGHGANVLMGWDVLAENDAVVLCEGELDYIIARQYGAPAICHTGGAAYWNAEWSRLFKDKTVIVAYDDDRQGDQGAIKVAEALAGIADDVRRARLDTGIKSGDVTDFFTTCGRKTEDFRTVVDGAKSISPSVPEPETTGVKVSLEQSFLPQYKGQTLEVNGVVIGSMSMPYYIPLKVTATCNRDAGNQCKSCPLVGSGEVTREIDRMASTDIMKWVNTTTATRALLLKNMFGARCRKVKYEDDEMDNLEVMFVQPVLTYDGKEDAETPIQRTVYNLGSSITQPNEQVKLVGRASPSPDRNNNVLYTWNMERVSSDIDQFEMTPAIYRRLKKFQPKDPGVTPYEKCKRIAKDLAHHTKMVDMTLMHVAMDLVWHSALSFDVDDETWERGWLDGLIIGDTRTGKSKTATRLMRYYKMGTFVSCETTTFAGLVGGSDKVNDKAWVVRWGVIPQNDRRLVVLDEFSGMKDGNIINRMSDLRESGIAKISSISGSPTARARTRLLWLTNPDSSNGPLRDSNDGMIPALTTLVPATEDQARFDFVMSVADGEVPSSKINKVSDEVEPRYFRSDDCHLLLQWVWSRKSEDVDWYRPAVDLLMRVSERMGKRYATEPPLILSQNVREKIARIAVAFAARTFSTDAKGERLIVKPQHVHSAVEFLNEVYESESNGYADRSDAIHEDEAEARSNMPKARKLLKDNNLARGALRALGGSKFQIRDLEEVGMERSEAKDLAGALHSMRMVTRPGRFYQTTKPLNDLVKELTRRG